MKSKRKPAPKAASERWYRSPNIPRAVIRRFARDVAEQFQPDKIILFGSYAYGEPHDDSDVDILVVMPARTRRSEGHRHWGWGRRCHAVLRRQRAISCRLFL